MLLKPYDSSMADSWNSFVGTSRNATFLFNRLYMDYHADRFPDCSLVLYDERGSVMALFPATSDDDTVYSHRGLTYGGWILGHSKPDQLQLIEAWNLMADYYHERGFNKMVYTPVPHIYHKYPAEEDRYLLFRVGAKPRSVLSSTVADLTCPVPFNRNTKRHIGNCLKAHLSVGEDRDPTRFWAILTDRLYEKYGSRPVHSLDEIKLLMSRFPEQIRLIVVRNAEGSIVAGSLIYICRHVIKVQYSATSSEGRLINAVDYLYQHIFNSVDTSTYRYLDFGPSNEDAGHILNSGLIFQKIGYGGRTIVYDSYDIDLSRKV